MRYRSLPRQAVYFALTVLLTLQVGNFPLPIDFRLPAGSWKIDALAITVLNCAICLVAFASAFLSLWALKARLVAVPTLIIAGILSGIELCQFDPFSFPLAFPIYEVTLGAIAAFVPMSVTLVVLGYFLGKRKGPTGIDLGNSGKSN
jgi:hypothetical protein